MSVKEKTNIAEVQKFKKIALGTLLFAVVVVVGYYSFKYRGRRLKVAGSLSTYYELVETSPIEMDSPDVENTTDVIKRMLDSAQREILIEAFFIESKLGKWFFRKLDKAMKRGVEVKIILNDSRESRKEVEKWKRYLSNPDSLQVRFLNIKSLGSDPSYGIVHSKVMIVDGRFALITSANYSRGGFYENREIGIFTRSETVISALETIFRRDWSETWQSDERKKFNWQRGVIVEGCPEEIDSPDVPNIDDVFLNLVKSAKKFVFAEIYFITDDRFPLFENALKEAVGRGVDVRVIVNVDIVKDRKFKTQRETLERLKDAGVKVRVLNVRYLGKERNYGVVHSKVVLVDDKLILAGSHNWTLSACYENRELSILVENKRLARKLHKILNADFDRAVELY